MRGTGVSIAPTRRVPINARTKRVTRSPRHAATGGVMLSGSMFHHRQMTTREHMKLPSTRALMPAAPIPVARTMTSCALPGRVVPSLHGSLTLGSATVPGIVVFIAGKPLPAGTSPSRCVVMSPRKKESTAARQEMRRACRPSNVILATTSPLRTFRVSSSPSVAEVPSRAERHISRLPLRFPIIGTRMNNSSTRRNTRHRAQCSNNWPLNTSPMSANSSEGVDYRQTSHSNSSAVQHTQTYLLTVNNKPFKSSKLPATLPPPSSTFSDSSARSNESLGVLSPHSTSP